MTSEKLKKRIRIATGKEKADLVIKNCNIVNVFTHEIVAGDIAFSDGVIAGIGSYSGVEEYDAGGLYALPGFIESHIHIESSMVTPEEFGRLAVPHGTSTIIADPHEICNVCGLDGLDYMLRAAKATALDIRYMIPSCVPCTEWEDAGARIEAEDMRGVIHEEGVGGIGEFMNAFGVLNTLDPVIDKIVMAHNEGAIIDGHAPGLYEKDLMGYLSAGIRTDHECGSVEEMRERLRGGMYVLMRYGSACKELPILIKGLTPENARRCLLCSDDRQSLTLLEDGELDDNLRICVKNGVDPITAVQMATLNAAECYGLHDRGAIAPGRRADVVLVDNLEDFRVRRVWIEGQLCAENGRYLLPTRRVSPGKVGESIHVKDFSLDRLRMKLKTNRVRVIDAYPGTVLSGSGVAEIKLDEEGDFLFDPAIDVARISVIERHHNTGNVANAFIRGYGIKKGAIALSIGHDSHNILVVGVSKEEMAFAVEELIKQRGGIVLTREGELLQNLPLPIGGLMSDMSAELVRNEISLMENCAVNALGVNEALDPLMTLCFMSLPVIPDLKITDKGLFDVSKQSFVPVELEE